MIIHVAREGFLQKHRPEMVDFLEDYIRTLRYLSDPANHQELVNIIGEATKQKPALFESWIFTNKDYYRDPNAVPDLDALQANVDLQHQLGYLRSPIDVKKYADLSLVKEAVGRLKAPANH
jgi:NitT/TauT family transport system substrate-binding protein